MCGQAATRGTPGAGQRGRGEHRAEVLAGMSGNQPDS